MEWKRTLIAISMITAFIAGTALGASAADVRWANAYGGPSNDYMSSGRATADGGSIITGMSYSFGSGVPWIIKLSETGSIDWQKSYLDTSNEYFRDIAETSDGFVVTGDIFGDLLLIKLNQDGSFAWKKSYGGPNSDGGRSISKTADEGFLIAGYWAGSTTSLSQPWLLKVDANGGIVWHWRYTPSIPTQNGAWLEFAHETADGGCILAGHISKYDAAYPDGNWVGRDIVVIKLSAARNIEWQKTYSSGGGTNDNFESAVLETSDGGYILAGFNSSLFAVWVMKLNTNGDVEWNKTYGGGISAGPGRIVETSAGNYAVPATRSGNIFLLEIDESGDLLWKRALAGPDFERAMAVEESLNGIYIVMGDTQSFGAGGRDFMVAGIEPGGTLGGCPAGIESDPSVTINTPVTSSSNLLGTGQTVVGIPTSPVLSPAPPNDTWAVITSVCAGVSDEDADGLSAYEESILGTDPTLWDTDGDGVNDLDDAFPLDPTESADSDGKEIRISPAGSYPDSPTIWGPYVIWEDERKEGEHDLYLYDLRTETETRLTNDSGWEERPRISGNRIVWEEWVAGSSQEIFIFDFDNPGKVRLTSDTVTQEYPQISGDRIVYSGPAYTTPVWSYDLSSSSENQISLVGIWPMISGDRIVWLQQEGISSPYIYHIWLHDIVSGASMQITDSSVPSNSLFGISCDNIVFDSTSGVSSYNISSDTTVSLSETGYWPSISGNKVVWFSSDPSDPLIMYDFVSGVTKQITTVDSSKYYPSIFGSRVAWLDARDDGTDGGFFQVYVYTGDGVGDNADNCPDVYNPDQLDTDNDGVGDACDNCPVHFNPTQLDTDNDGLGEVCDSDAVDSDNDGINDGWELTQFGDLDQSSATDFDGDGLNDLQEYLWGTNPIIPDTDSDGLWDSDEVHIGTNPLVADTDLDGVNDGHDAFPLDPNESADFDGDRVGDNADTCVELGNELTPYQAGQSIGDCAVSVLGLGIGDLWQPDFDCDGIGDRCDPDADGDGYLSPYMTNGNDCDDMDPSIYPGVGDCEAGSTAGKPPKSTDTNSDTDTWYDSVDNCDYIANEDQADLDKDNIGDVCDNCADFPNPAKNLPVWYRDNDGDGYSDGHSMTQCENPSLEGGDQYKREDDSALVANAGDCNDNPDAGGSLMNPGLQETPGDGYDNDCNPSTLDVLQDYEIQVGGMTTNGTDVSYNDWLPNPGAQGAEQIVVTFKVTGPNGEVTQTANENGEAIPGVFGFGLTPAAETPLGVNPTNHPGKYRNDPSEAGITPSPDFDPIVATASNQARLTAKDSGGSITVRVSVEVIDANGQSIFLVKDFAFPRDIDKDGLADKWEMDKVNGLAVLTSASGDPDGDGLTNIEEQGGVMWGRLVTATDQNSWLFNNPDGRARYNTAAYVPTGTWDGTVELIRTHPARRDLFVRFVGFGQEYPFALGAAFYNQGIDVHALAATKITGADFDMEYNIDTTTVELVSATYAGEDGHIYRRNEDDWSFKTLGYGTWDNEDPGVAYGSKCRVYKQTLDQFFTEKTHEDGETLKAGGDMRKLTDWEEGSNGKLDSLSVREDASDNGVLDGGEDKTRDGNIQGDRPVPGIADLDFNNYIDEWIYNSDLSPFDRNKDGLMELPVGDTIQQYHRWQVIKHVATHELGHNTGIDHHSLDDQCVMYDKTNNFLRDGFFNPDFAALIRIHNQ